MNFTITLTQFNFYSRPRAGAIPLGACAPARRQNFYSRPRAGAIKLLCDYGTKSIFISTHAPVRGRSITGATDGLRRPHFYSRPRAGAIRNMDGNTDAGIYFYSRPRAGAINTGHHTTTLPRNYFYSRPRAGAIPVPALAVGDRHPISTHAPVRGRSQRLVVPHPHAVISTHAPVRGRSR